MIRVCALAVVASLAACDGPRGPTAPVTTDDDKDSVKVASPEDLQNWQRKAPGHVAVIVARDSVDVPSKANGTVLQILVNRGDRVVKGQPLAKIDEDALRDELRQAKANLKSATASIRSAGGGADGKMCRRMRRAPDLFPRAEIETVCARAAAAGGRRGEAKAAAESAQIQVERIEKMLLETTVTAPYDGTIADVYANVGALLTRGAPVVRIIESDELWVRFAIPIEDKTKYKIGDEIRVALDSSDMVVTAVIRHLSPDVDPTLQMVEGEAELKFESESDRKKLQVGMATWVEPAQTEPPVAPKN